MTKKTKKIVARNATPRRRPSRSPAVVPAAVAVVATVAEHPGWELLRDLHTMMTGMQAKMDSMQTQHDAERVPVSETMIDAAQMLTIKQGCHVLSGMDDGRLYNRPHLIHRIAGTCYVGNDEIRAEFPNKHNQARFLEIVERNEAHAEPEPGRPLLSQKSGNDKGE